MSLVLLQSSFSPSSVLQKLVRGVLPERTDRDGTDLSGGARMRVPPLLGAAAALLAACGGSDPKQTLQKIDSAAATTALVSSALEARHVSRRYARATLRVLRDEVRQDAADAKSPPAVRAHADSVGHIIDLALAATASR